MERKHYRTETWTVTVLTMDELRDLLREAMAANGYDVDSIWIDIPHMLIIKVASIFDLEAPSEGTLVDVIEDSPPIGVRRQVDGYHLAQYLAVLTDVTLYGDKALPKTDYRIES